MKFVYIIGIEGKLLLIAAESGQESNIKLKIYIVVKLEEQ